MTVKESILHFNPQLQATQLEDLAEARKVAEALGIALKDSYGLGKVQIEIFEKTVEHRLKDPTFITAYPTEVSPLARLQRRRPLCHRPVRILRRRARNRQRLFRAQ